MTKAEVVETLQGIFREFFGDDALTLSASTNADQIDDWDSLANVELMVEVEEHFGIRFRTGQVAELENVGQLADLILADVRDG